MDTARLFERRPGKLCPIIIHNAQDNAVRAQLVARVCVFVAEPAPCC